MTRNNNTIAFHLIYYWMNCVKKPVQVFAYADFYDKTPILTQFSKILQLGLYVHLSNLAAF